MSEEEFSDPDYIEYLEADEGDEERLELCGCGCWYSEHDPNTGRCLYCFEEDCGGFECDEEATIIALATMRDTELP